MLQMLKKDTGCNNKLDAASEAASEWRRGLGQSFGRDTIQMNQKNEAFLAHKLLEIGFILLESGK